MCSRPDDMKEYWKGEEMEIRPFLEVIDTNFQEREDEKLRRIDEVINSELQLDRFRSEKEQKATEQHVSRVILEYAVKENTILDVGYNENADRQRLVDLGICQDEEDMKWNVQGIADENCINCERYKEDIYVSPCICEVVMDIIHRNCGVRNQEDEDFCANEWGKHRKKILTRLLRS